MKDCITVLSFALGESVEALVTRLSSLPYQINVVSPEDWLATTLSNPECAVIIVISGEACVKQEIFTRFEALAHIPKLCVLADTGAFKQRAMIDLCSDVITWPCTSEEIYYRFSKVLENYAKPEHSKQLDAGLRDQFIKMNLIGKSPAFSQALSQIQRATKHDVTVLLLGETGTGKELAARAIHYMGARAEHPFIPVNCGALPEEIFENEVFGHHQGAYTDAKTNQLGLVGQAQDGTLFLDEVDSLSLKSQVVLLRFLQDHQYRPLGGQSYKRANVRIVAATNADLEQQVKEGRFRKDLFFRLNILQINMPALRQRLADLPLLTGYLIRRFQIEYGGAERFLSSISYTWMRCYPWPGNVRELENVLLRAFLESEEQTLLVPPPEHRNEQLSDPNDPVDISGVDWDSSFSEAKSIVMDTFEKNYLEHILSKADGNVSQAAKLAGKERRALGKLIKKHGLKTT